MEKIKSKKWLTYLLSIMIALMLVPATVFAAHTGELVVNGEDILKASNYTVKCGDGVAVYDPDTEILTLNNAELNENFNMGTYNLNRMIDNSTNHDITINLVGDNVIGNNATWDTGYRINSEEGLTITGTGTLTVYGGNACIFSQGKMTIDGAKVTIYGNHDYGIASYRNDIEIKNGAMVIGEDCTILVTDYELGGDIIISDSTVIADASSDYNAICTQKNLQIENSTIDAIGTYPALFGYDITLINSNVTATATENWGIYAMNNLSIKGASSVLAKGEIVSLGAGNNFVVIPPDNGKVDVLAGVEEESASAIDNSPLSEKTNLNSLVNTNTKYFYSHVHTHIYNQEVVSEEYKADEAKCESAATYYKSCVCGDTGTETFESGQALGHDWDGPTWKWTEDYSSATVTFTCRKDSNHTKTMTAAVTSDTKEASTTADGKIIYTASIFFNGKNYTDTKTVLIEHTGTSTTPTDSTTSTVPTDPTDSTTSTAPTDSTITPEPTTPPVTTLGTPTLTATAKGTTKIKVSWKAVKGATAYQVYRYNAKTKKYVQLKKTTKITITDTKLTPGTSYAYKVRAYTVSGTKTVTGKASKAAKAVTKPQTPKIISVKKKSTTKADIKIRTVKNVKGYRIYEYMASTKKFKLIGKVEGKVYYRYNSKTKKFNRDKNSKVVVKSKGSVTQVTFRTANVDFKKYKRYRYKVRAYVTYSGKNIYSGYSNVKIVKR